MNAPLSVRFWTRVSGPDERGCRLRTGYVRKDGYGHLTFLRKQFVAHDLLEACEKVASMFPRDGRWSDEIEAAEILNAAIAKAGGK